MAETHGSQSTPHRPPVDRRMMLRLLGIGLVAAAIGIVLGLLIPWFPPAAAKQAHTIDTLYYVLIICTVPIFVLVTTVVLFSCWRWRMRPGEERLDAIARSDGHSAFLEHVSRKWEPVSDKDMPRNKGLKRRERI